MGWALNLEKIRKEKENDKRKARFRGSIEAV